MSEEKVIDIEMALMQRMDAIDRIARMFWAIGAVAFALGAWSTSMQWQITMIRSDINSLNQLGTRGSEKLISDMNAQNSERDKVIRSLQLNQQQLADSVGYLANDMKDLKGRLK